VVKEGLRIHPAVGLPLERVVGPSGLVLYDTTFPPGTIVGVNPWVIHRDRDIFGPDAEIFRPERWLEADADQKKRMDSAMFAFGGGARTCIGKNISLLEIYKLVPTLIRGYRFELARPEQELTLQNAFLVHQTGLELRIQKR
jgi:cytochrome P450